MESLCCTQSSPRWHICHPRYKVRYCLLASAANVLQAHRCQLRGLQEHLKLSHTVHVNAWQSMHASGDTMTQHALCAELVHDEVRSVEATTQLRAVMGNVLTRLKQFESIGLALAPLLDAVPALSTAPAACSANGGQVLPSAINASTLHSRWRKLHSCVTEWGLMGCHSWAPLLDGKKVSSRSLLQVDAPRVIEATLQCGKCRISPCEMLQAQVMRPTGHVKVCACISPTSSAFATLHV